MRTRLRKVLSGERLEFAVAQSPGNLKVSVQAARSIGTRRAAAGVEDGREFATGAWCVKLTSHCSISRSSQALEDLKPFAPPRPCEGKSLPLIMVSRVLVGRTATGANWTFDKIRDVSYAVSRRRLGAKRSPGSQHTSKHLA